MINDLVMILLKKWWESPASKNLVKIGFHVKTRNSWTREIQKENMKITLGPLAAKLNEQTEQNLPELF